MQDAARDIESAALQKPKGQEVARQAKVDSESVALQKPETQEAVKQVQVDAESAQLQKPETQQVRQWGLRADLAMQQLVYSCPWWLRTGLLRTICQTRVIVGNIHLASTLARMAWSLQRGCVMQLSTMLVHLTNSHIASSHALQIAKAAVRAEENAQLQQPQDVAASGTDRGGVEQGGADQLATGGGIKAPVKVQP